MCNFVGFLIFASKIGPAGPVLSGPIFAGQAPTTAGSQCEPSLRVFALTVASEKDSSNILLHCGLLGNSPLPRLLNSFSCVLEKDQSVVTSVAILF